MSIRRKKALLAGAAALALVAAMDHAQANDSGASDSAASDSALDDSAVEAGALDELRALIEAQRLLIEKQEQELARQESRIDALEDHARSLSVAGNPMQAPPALYGPGSEGYLLRAAVGVAMERPVAGSPAYGASPYGASHDSPSRLAVSDAQLAQGDAQQPVGEADPEAEDQQLDVSGLREAGGVLTPRGTVVFEPSIQYENSSTTRFFFNGIEVVDTVLIGDIEVTDADRDSITTAAAFRYGVTDRSEVELSVPFVYRADEVTTQDLSGGGTETNSLTGANIGDVEVSGRYQINDGNEGWPVFIGNLRVKTPTGQGPYDVDRDPEGLETELSTGSGFWAVEPGVTAVFRSDPAVFYASTSYLWHIGRDVDQNIGGAQFGDVDPGDVVGFGFGMGLAINERASFNIGYQHSVVFETTQEINGQEVGSDSFDVGALNLGFSYALSDKTSISLGTQVGVTEDAPDVVLTLRVPTSVVFD